MKNILTFIVILAVVVGGYFLLKNNDKNEPVVENEMETGKTIDETQGTTAPARLYDSEEWALYKNDPLGFSFEYPINTVYPRTKIYDGETGFKFEGINNFDYQFFGGRSRNYSEGTEPWDFEFEGYNNIEEFKSEMIVLSNSPTKNIQDITTRNGIQGVLAEDLYNGDDENVDHWDYPSYFNGVGQSSYIFNLKKVDAGLEFKFTRSEIPEYQKIIDSLYIYE